MKYIAVVAGRSGGHIVPGITIAQQYKKKNNDYQILFFATNNALDKQIIENNSIEKKVYLSVQNLSRTWYKLPLFATQMAYATLKSIFTLIRFRPKKLVVMGGYISLPVTLAAWLLRIPRELYELNAVPGKATRILAPFVNSIHVCFKDSIRFFPTHKTKLSDYPVRFMPDTESQSEARKALCLSAELPTLLILGGSQGSATLNRLIQQCFSDDPSLKNQLQIIHQIGNNSECDWQTWYKENGISALSFAFHHDLRLHYAAADIIIARAGAGSIFEIKFFNKPCILVPLEIPGNDHQLRNAIAFAKEYQDAVVVRQGTQDAVQNIVENIKETLKLVFS